MNHQKEFRLVGIGASAGGLEAINNFFDNIPDDTGLSFVVIQHLSPDFKSMMDELLTRYTEMPITVITEDTPVEPNNIYLISQRNNIIVEDGIIKQVDRKPLPTLNLPIDLFFHALGENFRERSIGVILSGTGTDGSRGIRTIKEAGGLVFVQDPKTAQFDGMPKAAISMNIADNVFSPEKIANEIVKITHKSYNAKGPIINFDLPNDQGTFQKILVRIEKFTNVDFREYRISTLVRRIEKRMYLNHVANLTEYYDYFIENEEEVFRLYKEFLIGVTRFFRDTEAFEIIKDKVIPELFTMKTNRDQIRIWCTGCSTGEEAYTIACLIMEYMEKHQLKHSFKIFATDLDEEAIRFGSQGVYHDNISADIPRDILDKYFTRQGEDYHVSVRVRENIVFTVHDALRDPPFINIDLVTCRNLLIYLNPSIQKNLLINFQFALNFLGYMFLGPSESITGVKEAFDAISNKWNIYKKIVKEKPIPASKERTTNLMRSNSNSNNVYTRSNPNSDLKSLSKKVNDNVFAKAMADKHAPRSLFVNEDFQIIYINGQFDGILRFPQAFAKLNLLDLVEEGTLLFKTGVRKCLKTKEASFYENVKFRNNTKVFELDIRFQQFKPHYNHEPLVWIEFYIKDEKIVDHDLGKSIGFDDYQNERLETLEEELRLLHKEKQLLIEQVETANEELQSSNEELLASNEELQSTNEELQSVNEELYTVNMELQTKVDELTISNNDINNLLESTEIGTIFLDKELRLRKFTPVLKEQFDLEQSDIGRSITAFSNSFKGENIYKEIKRVLAQDKFIEREISDQNGNTYLMRILTYKKDTGKIDGVIITFVNINELKRVQNDYQESAEIYHALVDNSMDIISFLDEDGIVMDVNIDSYGGYDKSDIIGSNGNSFVSEEYMVVYDNAFARVWKNQQSESFEFWAVNGLWFAVTFIPIVVEGKVKQVVGVSLDITKHKERERDLKVRSYNLEVEVFEQNKELEVANKELKEINNYLDSFVHGAAHDLRSPIMQMKGMISLFPKIKSMEKKEEIIQEFSNGVYHLESTINGLIEMIEFQKNTERLINNIDLVSVFENVKRQLSHELKNVNATIQTSFAEGETEIRYIKAYITSIFYNLLSNSIKYRSYDRPLRIKVSIMKKDIYTIISVKDNGIGIDLDRYGHFLFKPFKRLTLERQGTGIGLSIINNVAKKNGGKIEVKSKIDKGATFLIHLVEYPIVKPPEKIITNGQQV